jgi:hypothetical protein
MITKRTSLKLSIDAMPGEAGGMNPVCQLCGAPAHAANGIAVESAASAAKKPFLARITCNPDPLDGAAARHRRVEEENLYLSTKPPGSAAEHTPPSAALTTRTTRVSVGNIMLIINPISAVSGVASGAPATPRTRP